MAITIDGAGTITGLASGGLNDNIITDDELNLAANASNVKTALNASGTAPIYACRAWVNFDGTGTVAIRASGNVTGVTDNGTGDYKVDFTTAMPDNNYSAVASSGSPAVASPLSPTDGAHCSVFNTQTTSVKIQTGTYGEGITNNFSDAEAVSLAIIR
jgi:hypothetical protein